MSAPTRVQHPSRKEDIERLASEFIKSHPSRDTLHAVLQEVEQDAMAELRSMASDEVKDRWIFEKARHEWIEEDFSLAS